MKYDHLSVEKPLKQEFIWRRHPKIPKQLYLPLNLYLVGYAHWESGTDYFRERSKRIYIEYVRSGNVQLKENNGEYLIQPSEVYILHKGSRHFYTTGPEGNVNKYFIGIEGIISDYLIHILGLFNQIHIKLDNHDYIEQLFDELFSMANKSHENAEIETSVMLYQLLLELGKSISNVLPSAIKKALYFMHNNLGSSLSRNDICEYVNISPSHFNRLFLKYLKCSPIQYLLNLRLQRAADLLASTSLSVKEIAFITGFSDPLYFSSQFKKHMGVSPKFYRQCLFAHHKPGREYRSLLGRHCDPAAFPF